LPSMLAYVPLISWRGAPHAAFTSRET